MTTVIIITDTGKRTTSSASAEETDIANSGAPITLKGVELTYEERAILNTNASVGLLSTPADAGSKYGVGEVDHLGNNKPKWTARGKLEDDKATDLAFIKLFRELDRTKGYKTLGGTVPDWIDGIANGSTVNVHVDSFTLQHRSNSNIMDYTIAMFETD